ncbi:Mitochondrial 28S ribosomal protein S34 [Trypanosoma melophagium]|uniref:Mitochondrial 28S ribosomal protein S34 n=1 Tax=Trypanosoma melophagium TaxID=715481 RepID=UPI003519F7A5|nr:Mitochondrial 28S ribosomal protein S34 [Trypanosoma melophagium]
MLRLARVLLRSDSLNGGSSMTLGSKGMKLSPAPHRRRMPWTAAKEYFPGVVLNAKEKIILDGVQLVDVENIDRSSQADPLEVLRATVATYEFNTSTGKNIFQLASQVEFNGRGQKFFRKEWQEGTYDKYVTLSAIDFDRDGNKGTAYGYITFHGETTTRPVQIDFADVPGWQMEFCKERAVPFTEIVPPPPSIGSDVPVDPRSYRLKAYPYYDAPNPPEFVERLLKDRGVLPDTPTEAADPAAEPGAGEDDGSTHHAPK